MCCEDTGNGNRRLTSSPQQLPSPWGFREGGTTAAVSNHNKEINLVGLLQARGAGQQQQRRNLEVEPRPHVRDSWPTAR